MVNLSRSFKAAKNSIKETHNLLHSLSDMVRSDFKKNLSGLEESLNQRIDEAEKAILEATGKTVFKDRQLKRVMVL